MPTIQDLADELHMDKKFVRDILNEVRLPNVTKELQDKVFQTARKMGYDFKKLKIGKKMELRKKTLIELISHIEAHIDWQREEILEYLKSGIDMVKRVQKRIFIEEFPENKKNK